MRIKLDRVFPYSPDGIHVVRIPAGEYTVGVPPMDEEAARQALIGKWGERVETKILGLDRVKKVIDGRRVKDGS